MAASGQESSSVSRPFELRSTTDATYLLMHALIMYLQGLSKPAVSPNCRRLEYDSYAEARQLSLSQLLP